MSLFKVKVILIWLPVKCAISDWPPLVSITLGKQQMIHQILRKKFIKLASHSVAYYSFYVHLWSSKVFAIFWQRLLWSHATSQHHQSLFLSVFDVRLLAAEITYCAQLLAHPPQLFFYFLLTLMRILMSSMSFPFHLSKGSRSCRRLLEGLTFTWTTSNQCKT